MHTYQYEEFEVVVIVEPRSAVYYVESVSLGDTIVDLNKWETEAVIKLHQYLDVEVQSEYVGVIAY